MRKDIRFVQFEVHIWLPNGERTEYPRTCKGAFLHDMVNMIREAKICRKDDAKILNDLETVERVFAYFVLEGGEAGAHSEDSTLSGRQLKAHLLCENVEIVQNTLESNAVVLRADNFDQFNVISIDKKFNSVPHDVFDLINEKQKQMTSKYRALRTSGRCVSGARQNIVHLYPERSVPQELRDPSTDLRANALQREDGDE